MILTRARTLLRPCFARLLATLVGEPDGFAAGAFHARPLRWQSKSRRARKRALGRQSALRPLRFALVIGLPSLSLRVGSCSCTNHRQAYPPAEGCPLSGCSGRGAVTGLATALRLKQNACRQNTPAAPAQSVNWESTTLAPAFAARPKASVDIPSWRVPKFHCSIMSSFVV